ncbi:hypothetical protein PybrP1_000775 [[Pythium] brassicae (nom. inval.)]|nr:hypothetical protein PybrP1_000775 [[Pythium] brassicae (nom. inval.)]
MAAPTIATTAAADELRLPLEALGRVFAFAWTLPDAMERDLDDVARVLVRSKEATPRTDLMDAAAKRGKLAFVRALHVLGASCSKKAMDDASAEGNLAVVRFLHIHRREGCTREAMAAALKNQHTDVVRFLAKHRREKWGDEPIKYATENGDLALLGDLLRNDPSAPTADAKVIAYKARNTAVLHFLYEQSQDRRPTFNLVNACESGDLEMVEYLCGREGFVKVAMVEAVTRGSLAIVKHLHEHAGIVHTAASRYVPMNEAAASGQLEVLQYLHEHAPELACTVKAMDVAARRGHLAVVKFLNENRSEGCLERALDDAAMNGHLEVVRYLHEHSDGGCTTKAMDYAAARNHFEVLEFLHAHRAEGCTEKAFNDAALLGHARIVAFLLANRPEVCDAAKGIALAKQRNFVDVIALLEAHLKAAAGEAAP